MAWGPTLSMRVINRPCLHSPLATAGLLVLSCLVAQVIHVRMSVAISLLVALIVMLAIYPERKVFILLELLYRQLIPLSTMPYYVSSGN